MTLFWLWVGAGCAASALCAFSIVRIGTRSLARAGGKAAPAESRGPREGAARASARQERASAPPPPGPLPTAVQPAEDRLELWAGQVRAGERKMSVATDGCRVTWNRRCKHGHPSWLVYLGYLDHLSPPGA